MEPAGFSRPLKIKPHVWILGILLLAFAVRCYHITSPLDDTHTFRQTQTAGLIRDYCRDGIDLLYPRMITLGSPGYVVLEFPAYQALAAILCKVFSPDVVYMRLLTICFGLLSIVFIYRISRKFLDERSSVFAAFFYAFMPLNIFFQRVPIPDPLAILLSLIMLDFLIEGIKGRDVYLVIGIVAAALGVIIKSPVVGPLYLPLLYLAYSAKEKRLSSLARFFIALVIPLVVLAAWQHHANAVNDKYFVRDAYPFNYLYSSVIVKLKPLNLWYFGNISMRLDIRNYFTIFKYGFTQLLAVSGSIFFLAGFLALAIRKKGGFFFLWLLSICITVMVFFNLYVIHNYYHLFWAPVLAIFCGVGAAALLDIFRGKRYLSRTVIACMFILYFGLSLYFSESILFHKENDLVEVGRFIDEHVEKNVMIATSPPWKDAWNPALMFYSDRHGFNVPHIGIVPLMIKYLRQQRVKYVALVDAGGKSFPALEGSKIVAEGPRVNIYDISVLKDVVVETKR